MVLEEAKSSLETNNIIIPDEANIEETLPGIVVSKGEECKLPIEVGDKVLFKRYACEQLVFGSPKKEYFIGKEEVIFAKC